MAFKPTKTQQQAIFSQGATLVSAAAGSGKTAVLVQRVVQILSNEQQPTPADRLLIVTFTNAAAAEMKERIEKAMNERAAAEPENAYLQNQLLLLPMADICTIDSFCIKLVREHFNSPEIALSPDFKMLEGPRLENLCQKTVQALFEERYAAQDPAFERFVQATGSEKGDENAMRLVRELFDFCMTLPHPEQFLQNSLNKLKAPLPQTSFAQKIFLQLQKAAAEFAAQCAALLRELTDDKPLQEHYGAALEGKMAAFNALAAAADQSNFEACRSLLFSGAFAKVNTLSKKCNAELKAKIRQFVSAVEKWAKQQQKNNFYAPLQELEQERSDALNMALVAAELCLAYKNKLLFELRRLGGLTFSLCEQMALELLCQTGENGQPAAGAELLARRYSEVMVDEFQDVNDLQSAIFNALSGGGQRLFAVGDVKQSIYGFRHANPKNFKELAKNALPFKPKLSANTLKCVRLNSNFRSRAGVCRFINAFFAAFMSEEAGGVDYAGEQLNPEAEFPVAEGPCCEIHEVTYSSESCTRQQAVAGQIAEAVTEILGREPFLRGPNGTLRKAEPEDIAILVRAKTGNGELVRALKQRGITARLSEGSLFLKPEIVLLQALLQAVNNPLLDNSLLAVLMSPLFGFTANELAQLRAQNRSGRLFTLLLQNRAQPHCEQALQKLENYRRRAACLSVGALVEEMIRLENFEELAAGNYGRAAAGNLLYFQGLAQEFSAEPGNDLNAFLQYLENINTEAVSAVEQGAAGGVTIVTMHGSKGLQYPVCILANGMNHFNHDKNPAFLGDAALGLSFRPINPEKNKAEEPFDYLKLKREKQLQENSEEMRLLYVAMTRAEELLVLQLCDTAFEKKKQKAEELAQTAVCGRLPAEKVLEGNSFGSWVLAFTALCPPGELYRYRQFGYQPTEPAELPPSAEVPPNPEYLAALQQAISYQYPFTALHSLSVKTSVSQLTHQKAARSYCATARPAFLSAGGLTPAERGTAFHKFLQFANFKTAPQNVLGEVQRLYEQEFLTLAEAESIEPAKAQQFFNSALFGRIFKAKTVLREKRFMLEIPAGELQEGLPPELQSVPVMVQGAIDCMFFEPDGIVVLDFKTDRIKDDAVLLSHYREQLQLYCRAVEKMYETPVKECYLYALYTGREIRVD